MGDQWSSIKVFADVYSIIVNSKKARKYVIFVTSFINIDDL